MPFPSIEVLHSAVHLPKASARYLDWKARLPEFQEGKVLAGIRIRPTALPISHVVSPLGLTSGRKRWGEGVATCFVLLHSIGGRADVLFRAERCIEALMQVRGAAWCRFGYSD